MANTHLKAENGLIVTAPGTGSTNSYIFTKLYVGANVTVNADLFLVTGNVQILGNLTYSNTSLAGDLSPNIDQSALGNTTNRFNVFIYDGTVYNSLMPSTNGISFGNTTKRWAASLTTATATGNVTVNATALVIDATNFKVGVNTATLSNTFTVAGTGGFSSDLTTGGLLVATGNITGSGLLVGNTTIFANSLAITNTSQLLIDSFPKTAARMVKYHVAVVQTSSNDVHGIEMLAIHDTQSLLLTKYAEVYTTSLGTFDGTINNANVELNFTAAVANTYTVKVTRIITN